MIENLSKSIFVSHAATDKAIADKVVDLLNTAMGIDVHNSVFCTSLEGLKIPPGTDFKQFIKDQIQHPKIVLMLISKNYLASQFCLAEAGASWAMSHRIVPMLIPPVEFEDIKAVLAGINALKITDSSDWNEALVVFKEELKIDPNMNRWERKRDEQIAEIVNLLPFQPLPATVSSSKLKEMEVKLEGANEEIKELEIRLAQVSMLNQKIKESKDAQEVARIELENMPTAKAFEVLRNSARGALRKFRGAKWDAFYHFFRNEPLPLPRAGYSDGEERWEEIRRAIEDGYLLERADESVTLNESDPGIKKVLDALYSLKEFVDRTPELAESYEIKHGHQFDFRSRRFWDENLRN